MFFFPKKIFNQVTEHGGKPLSPPCPADYNHVWNHFANYSEVYNLQEVCITFRSKYHQLEASRLYRESKTYLQRYFRRIRKTGVNYIAVPEFNRSGILHYHLLIMFFNVQDTEYHIARFKRIVGNKYGRTVGKQAIYLFPSGDGDKKKKGYLKYMQKDINKLKHGYIRPFFHITPDGVI